MSDQETGAPRGDTDPPERDDAWDEIERQLSEFGQRMADLVRSAIDDPDTRRHARDVKERLEAMAGRIGDAVDSTASSPEFTDARERVGEAADTVAAAGRRAAGEAAPHVASALRVANEMLQGVVDRLDDRAQRERTDATGKGSTSPEEGASTGGEDAPAADTGDHTGA